MSNPGGKSWLLGGVTVVVVLGGFACLYAALRETQERLAQAEDRLVQLDRLANKAAEKPVSVAAVPAPAVAAEEFDALRADLQQLKQQLAALATPAATPKGGKDGEPEAVAAGDTASPFSTERLAAIKKVVEDTLKEREDNRRNQFAGMGEEWMKARRKQSLDELEQRLKLSAYQKDQLNAILEEQSKAAAEMLASAWGGGGGGNREETRKKWQELDSTTDAKVKQQLTAQQATEYDTWKQETGGWGGGMRAMGGGGGRGGRQGGTNAGGNGSDGASGS